MFKRPQANRPSASNHGLFADSAPEQNATTTSSAAYRANIDGGSRGNPGPASYGVVIRDPRGEVVAKLKKYIGRTTNNVAEYYGLIAALDYAQQHSIRALRIESDSELLVRQMRGQYKVKSADLRPLFERARKMSQTFASFKIDHVYRDQNAEADTLANEALDEISGLPAASPARQAATKQPPTQPRKLRAQVRNGTLIPLDPLDLPEGSEVEIMVRPIPKL
ncbi:MAG TPA: reverse transcriptase-like protein [Candidatus Acidoferrum sp.]|nr:reverse transcriptase-like protein [Candidatus Acidoferrum sp.]